MSTHNPFHWCTFDVSSHLPSGWQKEMVRTGRQCSDRRLLLPKHVTCRESAKDVPVHVATVDGPVVREALPWLYDFYHGFLLGLVRRVHGRHAHTAVDDRHGVVLNVQMGEGMRYEGHVDTNPIEGILFATTHAPGEGGELVFAANESARSIHQIDERCACIHPVSGHFVLFDGRTHPHYVRPLKRRDDVRVVAAMNFYWPGACESDRPPDLDQHLAGYALESARPRPLDTRATHENFESKRS